MSEVEAQFVKRGLWVNWSKGSVMGHTLTIDASISNVVVALLAICTSIGTAQLFNVAIFLYHQIRAHGEPSDGLYWQQQALLRTFPAPTALVADYMKLWWNWRTKTKRGMRLSSWLRQWRSISKIEEAYQLYQLFCAPGSQPPLPSVTLSLL